MRLVSRQLSVFLFLILYPSDPALSNACYPTEEKLSSRFIKWQAKVIPVSSNYYNSVIQTELRSSKKKKKKVTAELM